MGINNLPEHHGRLDAAFHHPADGITPTNGGTGEQGTDGIVGTAALDELKGGTLGIHHDGKSKEWKFDDSKGEKCRIRIPCSKNTGNLEVTTFWIDNAVYLREDLWDCIKEYPDEIEFNGHTFKKSRPRIVKFWKQFKEH